LRHQNPIATVETSNQNPTSLIPPLNYRKGPTASMEGVAVDNLIDFDLPSEASALGVDGGKHHGRTDLFSPEEAPPSTGIHRQPLLPEPMVPTEPGSSHRQCHQDGDNDSDATESADSENDMDPPSHAWELRRSSSSSAHSGEGGESAERKQFMKAYVEKVFHGRSGTTLCLYLRVLKIIITSVKSNMIDRFKSLIKTPRE